MKQEFWLYWKDDHGVVAKDSSLPVMLTVFYSLLTNAKLLVTYRKNLQGSPGTHRYRVSVFIILKEL